MVHFENKTVAEIVTENINTAHIFEKYNIDFGFNGKIVLKKACKNHGINLKEISKELKSVNQKKFYLKDYKSWDLELLQTFLVDIHHNKNKEDIDTISSLNEDIYSKYAMTSTEVKTQYEIIKEITKLVSIKMEYEESNIFPYIKKLNKIKNNQEQNTLKTNFLKKKYSEIEEELLTIRKKFKKIIRLTDNFKTPENTDLKLKLLFRKLKGFYSDLQKHNHIEKNILFPRVIQLEESLLESRL